MWYECPLPLAYSPCLQSSQSVLSSEPQSSFKGSWRVQCGVETFPRGPRCPAPAPRDELVTHCFSAAEDPQTTKSTLVLCALSLASHQASVPQPGDRCGLPAAGSLCHSVLHVPSPGIPQSCIFLLYLLLLLPFCASQEILSNVSYNHPWPPFMGQGCCLTGERMCTRNCSCACT